MEHLLKWRQDKKSEVAEYQAANLEDEPDGVWIFFLLLWWSTLAKSNLGRKDLAHNPS